MSQPSSILSVNYLRELYNTANITVNLSGLGSAQALNIVAVPALAAGNICEFNLCVPSPAPLIYVQIRAGDSMKIYEPDGVPIQYSQNGNVLNWQPMPGGVYDFVLTLGTAVTAGSPIFQVQAVQENTIGQYINLAPNVPRAWAHTIQVRTGVTLNTTSAIPNTLFVDFLDTPVEPGVNILANFNITMQTSAVTAWGTYNATTIGASTSNVQLMPEVPLSIQWIATVAGKLRATYSVAIPTAGTAVVLPTLARFYCPDQYALYPKLLETANQQAPLVTELAPGANFDSFDYEKVISRIGDLVVSQLPHVVKSQPLDKAFLSNMVTRKDLDSILRSVHDKLDSQAIEVSNIIAALSMAIARNVEQVDAALAG